MSDTEKLVLAEAMGALKQIADCDDAYVSRALAWAAIFSMAQIAKTGTPPTDEALKEFLRSQGFVSGVTRSGGN